MGKDFDLQQIISETMLKVLKEIKNIYAIVPACEDEYRNVDRLLNEFFVNSHFVRHNHWAMLYRDNTMSMITTVNFYDYNEYDVLRDFCGRHGIKFYAYDDSSDQWYDVVNREFTKDECPQVDDKTKCSPKSINSIIEFFKGNIND